MKNTCLLICLMIPMGCVASRHHGLDATLNNYQWQISLVAGDGIRSVEEYQYWLNGTNYGLGEIGFKSVMDRVMKNAGEDDSIVIATPAEFHSFAMGTSWRIIRPYEEYQQIILNVQNWTQESWRSIDEVYYDRNGKIVGQPARSNFTSSLEGLQKSEPKTL